MKWLLFIHVIILRSSSLGGPKTSPGFPCITGPKGPQCLPLVQHYTMLLFSLRYHHPPNKSYVVDRIMGLLKCMLEPVNIIPYMAIGSLQVWLRTPRQRDYTGFSRWPQFNPKVLIGGRYHGQSQKKKMWWFKQKLGGCPLKIEKGAMSQGMKAASRSRKRPGKRFFPGASRKNVDTLILEL